MAEDEDAWRYDANLGYVRDRNGDVVCGADPSLGRWIAAMSPAVAEPLAAWLENTALWIESEPRIDDKHALDFARLITHTEGAQP
jgi:hypothetical protein